MSNDNSAEYLKDIRDWIKVAIILAVIFTFIYNGGGVAILYGIGFIYESIYYDVLGNERFHYGIPSTPSYSPIEECNYSEDRHICYQLSRIADVLENKTKGDTIG